MKITKFGHSCLLVEHGGARILIDPGSYSTAQNDAKNIDAILITHEHQDHLSSESLKAIIANNPNVQIFANEGAGMVLGKEGIACTLVEPGKPFAARDITIEAVGRDHAVIHSSIPQIRNTGYLIANRLFHPGDAFTDPGRPVEILALPVSAPWLKISEAVDYALAVKPKICFPIHDGMLKITAPPYSVSKRVLEPQGITFEVIEPGASREF